MSEFDELVSRKGVLVAGRFGPDWRVAEQKSTWLVIEEPQAIAMISLLLCVDLRMLLNTMALAMSDVTAVSWQPVKGWGVSSGVYSFAMHGDRFIVGETEKLGSIDELLDLLRQGTP